MKKKLKEKIKFVFGGLFIFAAILFSVYNMRKKAQKEDSSKIHPKKMDIINKKVIFGTIEPLREVKLKPSISGILEKLYTQVGTRVRKGTQIARISPIIHPSKLSEAETNYELAKIKHRSAKSIYEKDKILYKKHFISKLQFEKSESEYLVAKQEENNAKSHLDLSKKGYVSGKADSPNIVFSTINGIVLELPNEEGSSVYERNPQSQGSDIAVIADMEKLLFKGKIDEKEAYFLKEGMELDLKINVFKKKKIKAVLKKISPKGIVINGITKFPVECEISMVGLDDNIIRAGYSAVGEVIVDEARDILTINEKYLLFENGKPYVYLNKGGKKKKVDIEIGISDGINIEVKKGLKEKDELYVEDDNDKKSK